MKKPYLLLSVLILGGCMSKTAIFDDVVIRGDMTISGTINQGELEAALATSQSAAQDTNQFNPDGFYTCDNYHWNPGVSWTPPITNPFGGTAIIGICYGNGVLVAVGNGGKIARSTNYGVTWGALIGNPFGGSDITGISYGNGVFVAVGKGIASTKIARSTDYGVTWGNLIANPLDDVPTRIVYGNGVFITLEKNSGKISISTDYGVTWGGLINPGAMALNIAYGNGVFVAVGGSGHITRSTNNGQTWSSLITNPFGADIWNIAYGNGVFVAAGTGSGEIARSTDYGVTWGSLISDPFNNIWIIEYGNGVFIISSDSGMSRSVDNGLTWSAPVLNTLVTSGGHAYLASSSNLMAWSFVGVNQLGVISLSPWLTPLSGAGFSGFNTSTPYNPITLVGVASDPSGTHQAPALMDFAPATDSTYGTLVGTDLVIGMSKNSPYEAWIQNRSYTADATYYPLVLQPMGGNVGIGTTSPIYKLQVTDATTPLIAISNDTTTNRKELRLYSDLTNNVGTIQYVANGANSNLALNPNGGNVGIAKTNPNSALAVVGLPIYATNVLALAGGLTAGDFYRTGAATDLVCVVH